MPYQQITPDAEICAEIQAVTADNAGLDDDTAVDSSNVRPARH